MGATRRAPACTDDERPRLRALVVGDEKRAISAATAATARRAATSRGRASAVAPRREQSGTRAPWTR
eukprot:2073994-Prymnesium_polylepis.1